MSCDDGSCTTEKGAGCCKKKCGSAEWGGCCDMSSAMLQMADDAWACLMKEKMKAHWEKKKGKHMDKKAAAVVDAAMAYWENKMDGMSKKHEMLEKMQKAMM